MGNLNTNFLQIYDKQLIKCMNGYDCQKWQLDELLGFKVRYKRGLIQLKVGRTFTKQSYK